MALADIIGVLACPQCHQRLVVHDRAARCPAGHTFDVARQGYLNLLGSRPPGNADTPAMVLARSRFLAGGHYAPLAEALTDASSGRRIIVDAGAGTGYYLTRALSRAPDARGVALDVSVPACRQAARTDLALGAIVADTWQRLPLLGRTVDAVWSVFAPRNFAEFARVLRPGGIVVVVTPGSDHLAELRRLLDLMRIEAGKQQRLREAAIGFSLVSSDPLQYSLACSRAALADLVAMGPNAFHADPGPVHARLAGLTEPLEVTASFRLTVFQTG